MQGDVESHTYQTAADLSGLETDADKMWFLDNIVSLRMAVQQGKHSTLYYPACGQDVLRTLLAYDPDEMTLLDIQPAFAGTVESQLSEVGIEHSVERVDEPTRKISFELGRPRVITEIVGDARMFRPQLPVDVLHIYLPTGAEDEVALNDDSYAGMPASITRANLDLVNPGGFLILNERRLIPEGIEWPPTLLAIVGLKEHEITRRHPYNVMTSFFPSREELADISTHGYTYQKIHEVSEELIEPFNALCSEIFWLTSRLDDLYEGCVVGIIGQDPWKDFESGAAIREHFARYNRQVEEIAGSIPGQRLEEATATKLKAEMKQLYLDQFSWMQNHFREFLTTYTDLIGRLEAGEISEQQILEVLEVTPADEDNSNPPSSKKWPCITAFISGNEQRAQRVYDSMTQFVEQRLDSE